MSEIEISNKQLDLAKIETLLNTNWLGRSTNEFWSVIDSTNTRAIELARRDAAHGALVIASEQTAGRGRSGNAWLSPAHSGLYMSFIIRPRIAMAGLPVITLATGVAVVQAIQSCLGIKVGLKWVNDLIADGKKVGGILAEYTNSRDKQKSDENNSGALIIGIGLNLYKPQINLPLELDNKIGFLANSLNQNSINKNLLVASIANELERVVEEMQSDQLQSLLNAWRVYSVTLGEEIVTNIGDKQIKGQALDISEGGELIVKTPTGKISLVAGEVSIRKPGGMYI